MSDHVNHEAQSGLFDPLDDFDWSYLDAFDWATFDADQAEAHERPQESQYLDPIRLLGQTCSLPAIDPTSAELKKCHKAQSISSILKDASRNRSRSHSLVRHAASQLPWREARRSDPHQCTKDGCGRWFKRKYELDRHVSSKHRDDKPYRCTVLGCLKGVNATAFARADKLTDHYKACHDVNDPVTCPTQRCDVHLSLDLIGGHITLAHRDLANSSRLEDHHLNAVKNASDSFRRKCLYWRCRNIVKLDEFMKHILEHFPADLDEMEVILNQQNYSYIRNGYTHHTELASAHSVPNVAMCILCPVPGCGEAVENRKAFEQHVLVRHLLVQSPGMAQHCIAWKSYAVGGTRWVTKIPHDAWGCWTRGHPMGLNAKIICPDCQKDFGTETWQKFDARFHHLEFLRNKEEVVAELYPVP